MDWMSFGVGMITAACLEFVIVFAVALAKHIRK